MNKRLVNKSFLSNAKKYFSLHTKIAVIGGGTGGINTTNQLIRAKVVTAKDITVFDPSAFHYYQAAFTKIGGGVIGSQYIMDNFVKYEIKNLTKHVNFQNQAVKEYFPEEKAFKTANGDKWTYDKLVVTAGLLTNWDSFENLRNVLEDPNSKVCSIYGHEYSLKTRKLVNEFKGGKAIFTQYLPPIKCAGAPQKILYLAHDHWNNKGVDRDIKFYTAMPTNAIFAVPFYSDALRKLAEKKGLKVFYNFYMTKVTTDSITFKNSQTGEEVTENFDFCHLTPPLSAPLKGSSIADANGFIDVDNNLRHKRFKDIYAAGDCVNLLCSKTASAVYSQVPVLVQNLEKDLTGKGNDATYNGYSACPIYTQKGKMMMAEFATIEHPEKKTTPPTPLTTVEETFYIGKQNIPSSLFYYIGKAFTFIYYWSITRVWYGNNTFFRPTYTGTVKHNDIRKYLRWIVKAVPFSPLLLLLFFFI